MLYALSHPVALVVLVASFVLGLTLHGWIQALVARWLGDRRPAQGGRTKSDPRLHVDPFGAIAALISGLGWVRPVELHGTRRARLLIWVNLAGPAVNLALGVLLLLAWRLAGGVDELSTGGASLLVNGAAYGLQRGFAFGGPADVLLLVGASQLYLGALSLVPLPPLDGGRLLFGLAPRTHGWLRAEHHLVERNIGVAVLLALLLIPLGGPVPVLPDLLDVLLAPVLRLLCGV